MLAIYCPAPGCGAENRYSGSKPVTCAKCGNPFAAAFKSVATAPDESKPDTVGAKKRRRLSMSHDVEESKPMTPINADFPIDPAVDQETIEPEDHEDEDFPDIPDANRVSAYAEELKAGLNMDDISVRFADEPIRIQIKTR